MSALIDSYISLSDDLFLIEVEVQHDFFGSDIIVVMLVRVESDKDGFLGFCTFHKCIFLLGLIGSIIGDVVLSLCSVFVAFHIADHDEFGVFGSVDAVPFLLEESLRLFLHQLKLSI
jgi:hypothetical protein